MNEPFHVDPNQRRCEECKKTFLNNGKLITHILLMHRMKKTTEKEKFLKCLICDRTFKRMSTLRIHLLVHSNERPFQCDLCDKAFTRKVILKKHRLKHDNEPFFKCLECDRPFMRINDLRIHQRVHTNELFMCSFCGKHFTHDCYLKRHLLVHTKEKAFKCDVCGKGFTHKYILNTHQLSHKDERPFKCRKCGETFNNKYCLKQHHLVDMIERPFECNACNKSFKDVDSLTRHLRTVHGPGTPSTRKTHYKPITYGESASSAEDKESSISIKILKGQLRNQMKKVPSEEQPCIQTKEVPSAEKPCIQTKEVLSVAIT